MSQKTKILFAITKGNWGGAQRYVFDLATNLPKDLFDVSVICGEGSRLTDRLEEKYIRTIRLESLQRDVNILRDAISFFDFLRLLRKERPDVIHLNSSKIGAIGALAGRLAGVPKIVFTGHGWAWNENRNFAEKAIISSLHWLTVVLAHKTIAVSEEVERQIRHLPLIPKSKIIVVHNGISDIEYVERFAARATFNQPISEKFWVGTISELHKNKGLDVLVKSFAEISQEHPDATLIIIGEGEERARLTKQISDLNLTKKIHLIGFVDDARKFLKAFDVFVLSSRTEAFPYVILEAGLAQMPAIATKVGGIPEVISDNKNGLLVPRENSKALATAIKKLLSDSTMAAVFGQDLRKTVEKSFSVHSMVEKTIAVYNE